VKIMSKLMSLILTALPLLAMAGRDEEKRVPADPEGQVRITNTSGSVRVIGWDRAEVDVKAELGGGVERLDVVDENGDVRIEVVLPSFSIRDGSADLVVHVPVGSQLEVTAVSAEIKVTEVSGPTRLKTVSGDVVASLSSTEIEMQSVSGDVTLNGGRASGNAQLKSVSGDVSIKAFAGSLDAASVSGDVVVNMEHLRDLHLRSTSGDVVVSGALDAGARIEAESVSGDVKLGLPAREGFVSDIETFSGDIGGCFSKQVTRTSKHGPGKRLYLTEGNGDARIRVKSFSGDVVFCDE
jgi:DUF4097 and DUF4098 domain-containing protein YvlB